MFEKLTESTPNAILNGLQALSEGVKGCLAFSLDAGGHVCTWNPGAEAFVGYTAAEIVGRHFRCLYTFESSERGEPEEHLESSANCSEFKSEGWRLRKDGSRFWADALLVSLRDSAGRVQGFGCFMADSTERKRVDDSLLLQLSNVLIYKLDVREFLSAIGAAIREFVPHDVASLAIPEPGGSVLRLVPLNGPYEEERLVQGGGHLQAGRSPEVCVYGSGKPLIIDRFRDAQFSCSALERSSGTGIKSACYIPLPGRQSTLGTLNVARRTEETFTSSDIRFLTQIARRVGTLLDSSLVVRRITELKGQAAHENTRSSNVQAEYSFEEIIGDSPILKRILAQAETVAPTDATVLILGETGVGKELIARAIHDLSPRRSRSFVRFNCAAIPTGLLESELFGYEKGAFTGANAQRLGRLDIAHQGTLFLDEVGDIPLELQPKLLRALQEKEFERLGSTRTIPVDVRLIAATNRDLARMVWEGQFRSDLYYRLKVFPIVVPPLREHREDIPLLVRYFVQKHAFRMNKRVETIPPEAMDALVQWDWPGNVRELGNFLERAVILTRGSILHVPLSELQAPRQPDRSQSATLKDIEREHILRVLRETRGVVGGTRGAAARLGLNRSTLNSRMRKLQIERRSAL
jgi:formate hydrogenlyase transcriptional activator